jgi:murein DD-endopeptidase MepM/ murein hydrolase activator NlpD
MLKTATLSRGGRSINRRWFQNPIPMLWPVNGRLLSHFGRRDDPFSGLQAFHAGVDISASVGTPVRVTADGIVQQAEWGGAYGKLIVVDHGSGRSTFYAHLSRVDVIPGQDVRMGQIVGAAGATGRVTSPHLHYEVREGGGPINPYKFLSRSSIMPATGSRTLGF